MEALSTRARGRALLERQCAELGVRCSPGQDSGTVIIARLDGSPETVRYFVRARPEHDGGGGGAPLVLPWRFPDNAVEDWIATIDLSTERIWLFRMAEVVGQRMFKQHKNGKYLLSIYLEPTPYQGLERLYEPDFEPFLLQRRLAAPARNAESLIVEAAEAILEGGACGQGFEADPVVRREIERYAMSRAIEHFADKGYSVTDQSASNPYDILCQKGRHRVCVKVKGTISSAARVLLSRGEVEFNRRGESEMALFIQRNVRLTRDDSGIPSASGGDSVVIWPWVIDDSAVIPITVRYTVPHQSGS